MTNPHQMPFMNVITVIDLPNMVETFTVRCTGASRSTADRIATSPRAG